jgi:hypothetical protein
VTILNPTPCSDWVLKLSARHPDDLSPSDRIALNEHLALCQACSKVHTSYQTMEAGIRSLLITKPNPMLTYQHTQLKRKPARESGLTLPGLITLVLSVFPSLFITISWSSFYQKLQTWVLIVIAHYPRKVTYVNSNNYHTFAICSDSGFFLWQQERYQNHGIISTLPIHWSGMYNVVRVFPMSGL